MKNTERNISKLVNRFIKESFVDITDMDTDKAVEEVTEKTHDKSKKFGDGRDRIDVAEPKGKITGADFKKLQSMKKHKEMNEIDYTDINDYDDIQGGYYNPNREKYDRLSKKYPGVVMSHGDYDKSDEELDAEYAQIMGLDDKLDINDPNFRTRAGFRAGEMVSEEGETEEGNEFTGALAKAKEEGKDTFNVDGKEYKVTKESVNKKIERILERRRSKVVEKPVLKQRIAENKVVFTESELIDFIERLVESEIKTDKDTTNALSKTKKVNVDATKEVVEKMKDYMKNMGMDFEESPKSFPKGNSKMSRENFGKETTDDKKKAYKPSDAVDEYIDQIARSGGMEVLEYDQIKPNEEWLEMNIEGSSKTGNSQEYANAVPTDVNKNVNRRRKLNVLNKLKKQSYQKAEQPVYDVAGEDTHMEKMLGIEESIEEKKVINEMEKMKKLINYNQKTQ